MKTIILYKTRYGSTKQYAEWLSKDLKSKAYELNSTPNLNKYDCVIAMSGVYGGQTPLIPFLKKHWGQVKDKKIIMIAVGVLPPNHWWSKMNYAFFPQQLKRKVQYFKIYGQPPESGEPIKKDNLKPIKEYLKKNIK